MSESDDATQPTEPRKRSLRIQAWMPDAETDARIRNAFLAVGHREGYGSLGELLWRPALTVVEEWEKRLNGGKPFEAPTTAPPSAGRAPRSGHPRR